MALFPFAFLHTLHPASELLLPKGLQLPAAGAQTLWESCSEESFQRYHGPHGCCREPPYQKAGESSGLEAALFCHPFKAGLATMELALYVLFLFLLLFLNQGGIQAFCKHFLLKSEAETRYKICGSVTGTIRCFSSFQMLWGWGGWGHGNRRWLAGRPDRGSQHWTLCQELGFSSKYVLKSYLHLRLWCKSSNYFSEFPVAN